MRLLIAHKSDESPIKYSKISNITFKKSLMRDNISIFGPIQTMQYDDGINWGGSTGMIRDWRQADP